MSFVEEERQMERVQEWQQGQAVAVEVVVEVALGALVKEQRVELMLRERLEEGRRSQPVQE